MERYPGKRCIMNEIIRKTTGHEGTRRSTAASIPAGIFFLTLISVFSCGGDSRPPELLKLFEGHSGAVSCIAFSKNGRIIASSDTYLGKRHGRSVIIRSFPDGRVIHKFEDHADGIGAVALSPDGRLAASGGADKKIIIRDVKSGKQTSKIESMSGRIMGLDFSPDGRSLAAVDYDGNLCLFAADGGRKVWSARENAALFSVRFSPDGRLIAAGGNGRHVVIRSAATGKPILKCGGSGEGHGMEIGALSFTSDGKKIISCSSDKTMKVWDAATGRLLVGINENEQILSCDCSPGDRSTAACAGRRGNVVLYNLDTGAKIKAIKHYGDYHAIRFSPDGRQLAAGNRLGEVIIFKTGK